MTKRAMMVAALLALAGCSVASPEDRVENAIREELAKRGTVREVTLTRQDADNLTGHATIRDNRGRESRLNCTARRSTGTNYDWSCSPAIDETLLQDIESMIRDRLAAEGEVIEVEMQRAGDEDNMAGHVLLRDAKGGEVRTPCRAVRDVPGDNLFSWRCGSGAEAWAAARNAGRGNGGTAR